MLPLRGGYITLLAQIQSIQLRQKLIHSVAELLQSKSNRSFKVTGIKLPSNNYEDN